MSNKPGRTPWRYAPESDSDGFSIGTDHFILDADGNEIANPPTQEIALAMAAAHDLLEAAEEIDNCIVWRDDLQRWTLAPDCGVLFIEKLNRLRNAITKAKGKYPLG